MGGNRLGCQGCIDALLLNLESPNIWLTYVDALFHKAFEVYSLQRFPFLRSFWGFKNGLRRFVGWNAISDAVL